MNTVLPPQPRLLLPVPGEGSDGRQCDEQVHHSGHTAQALRPIRPGGGQVSFNIFLIYILKRKQRNKFVKEINVLANLFLYDYILSIRLSPETLQYVFIICPHIWMYSHKSLSPKFCPVHRGFFSFRPIKPQTNLFSLNCVVLRACKISITESEPQSTYICGVQNFVWRLPKYWPPPPPPPRGGVPPPPPNKGGGYTLAGRRGGRGVNIFRDIGLLS